MDAEPEESAEAVPKKLAYPGFWSAVGLLFLEVAVGVLTAIAIALVVFLPATTFGLDVVPLMPAVIPIMSITGSAAALLFAYRRSGRPPLAELFPWRPVPSGVVGAMVASVVGVEMLSLGVASAGLALLGSAPPREYPLDPVTLDARPWIAFLMLMLLAPIGEELMFRGVMMRGFLGRYSRRRAILANAVLFGLAHVDPLRVVPTAMIGGLLAWWRARTGSVKQPMIAHSLVNGVPLTVALIALATSSGSVEKAATERPNIGSIVPCSILLLTVGAVVTWFSITSLRRQFDEMDKVVSGDADEAGESTPDSEDGAPDGVRCPSCGRMVAATADECPGCGKELVECDQCGATVLASAEVCTGCGEPFEDLADSAPAETDAGIVECPACGETLRWPVDACAGCGEELAECDQCGAIVRACAEECDGCGEPFED